jgi:hypothetical protein
MAEGPAIEGGCPAPEGAGQVAERRNDAGSEYLSMRYRRPSKIEFGSPRMTW